jgi:hypothetical protein
MSSLRDIMDTSNVSIKQIQDHYKKRILNEVESIKSRKRSMPLSAISKELDVSESTILRYRKDLNCTSRRRTLTTSQKYDAQLKMQLGKAKAKFIRDEYSEAEYKKKVSEIENKFALANIDRNEVSRSISKKSRSERGNPRGGAFKTAVDSDDDEPKGITEDDTQRRLQANKISVNKPVSTIPGITKDEADNLAQKYLNDVR